MKIAATLLFFMLSVLGIAQCGTITPKSYKNNPVILSSQNKDNVQYNLERTLSVHIYIVASEFETYDYGTADYMPDWDFLNTLFDPIKLSFQICEETLIPEHNWNSLDKEPDIETGLDEENEMLAQFFQPNVINVYYVDEIINMPGDVTTPAGYAYFPGGLDVIMMTKGGGQWTLAHEMGHFFGLYHTFEGGGNELVNGSNCAFTGDLVCDTPADINGNSDGCVYTDMTPDPNGDIYTPYMSNIMSYYGGCEIEFTGGQYNRLAWHYLNVRNYLW